MDNQEQTIILKAQNGDKRAFEELIHKYDKKVMAMAFSFHCNKDDAKDVFQEVFFRAFRSINSFRSESEFSTWLYRISINVCLSYKSKKARKKEVSIDSEIMNNENESLTFSEFIVGKDSTDKKILNSELSEIMNRAVNKLPAKQKTAFILKHYQEYKISEIAKIVNCSEGAVKRYLFLAIRKLRKQLAGFVLN